MKHEPTEQWSGSNWYQIGEIVARLVNEAALKQRELQESLNAAPSEKE